MNDMELIMYYRERRLELVANVVMSLISQKKQVDESIIKEYNDSVESYHTHKEKIMEAI